jgi:tRNA-(ms[2]io[6]A)-hydroxylase
MLNLAKEELTHFEMVHQKIKERGYKLGFERKDEYVLELYKFMRKGHVKEIALIDRLLFSAMVEARSCERFKLLSENINDPDLRKFYHELMISEAGHYTMFLAFARKYGNATEDVNARWQQWLDREAEILKSYCKQETIHG